MVNLRRWSQTATGNATVAGGASTINFAEGQLPSTVNNSAREMMAQIRKVYTPSEWGWVECSATASVASQTTFKLTGNQTADYTAGRRWRIKSGSTTRYGSIVSSSFTTETTVTVTVDSGSLSASHTLAAVAAIDNNHIPSNTYLTSASLVTSLSPYITSNSVSIALSAYITSASVATALSPYITSNSVSIALASAGGITSLGSISTASGASASLGSLTLTSYKFLRLVFKGVSANSATSFLIGNSTADDVQMTPALTNASFSFTGTMIIDLTNAVSSFHGLESGGGGTAVAYASSVSPLTTSSTAVSIAPTSGALDAGTVYVYGER